MAPGDSDVLLRLSVGAVLGQVQEAACLVNADRRIVYWNPAAERLTGYRADEVVGKLCYEDAPRHVDESGTDMCDAGCPLVGPLTDGQHRQVRAYLQHKRGHRLPVDVSAYAIRNDEGRIIGAIEFSSDATPVRILEDQIERLTELAFIDGLTRLPNRRYAQMRLEAMLSESVRYEVGFGVLMMDIDHFKQLNDTHGHKTGDRVLAVVSDTLSRSVRPSDVVARWGGEEFLVLVPHADSEGLRGCAERCRLLVESSGFRPTPDSPSLGVTISAGATVAMQGDTAESVVARADAQMYESKAAGRNCVMVG